MWRVHTPRVAKTAKRGRSESLVKKDGNCVKVPVFCLFRKHQGSHASLELNDVPSNWLYGPGLPVR